MNDPDFPPRFAFLIGKYLDESISPAETAELEAILLDSASARTEFYAQLETSARLAGDESDASRASGIIELAPVPSRFLGLRQRWFLAGSAAAALVVTTLFLLNRTASPEAPAIVERPVKIEPVAEPLPIDPEERYVQTMAKIGESGSQSRPPAKATPATSDGELLSYNRDIRPILSDRCFACHGPDANTREADLRLDTAEGAYAALDPEGKWHQIKPGAPETSEVFYRITTDDEEDVMPPPEAKLPRMTKEEVALIERWIREGAKYEQHWAFTKIERPVVPDAIWPDRARNEINHFIQEKLNASGFEPAPEADPNTLLRRIHFDLTGLPPGSDRVKSVADEGLNDETYAAIKSNLFGSVHHAEHFATRWLDKARYADTTGYQYDTPRIMWKWRDWVIDAYHDNKPYDEFLIEQIAGDLLPDATRDQVIATGYNRNHPITIEGGTIEEEYRIQYVSDRVNTVGSSILGLTMECAKCHDHKYDPISQQDYFRMFAFFNNIPEGGRASQGKVGSVTGALAEPYIFAPSEEQETEDKGLTAAINAVHQSVLAENGSRRSAFQNWKNEITGSVGWSPLVAAKVSGSEGLTFENLGDGSWLVAGDGPGKGEVYNFEIPMKGAGWQSLLLEALQHESLPNKGPGRSTNANAVLSRLDLFEVAPDGTERPLSLANVSPSYEQEDYPASNLIKNPGGAGWGFFHPKMEDRSLVAAMKEPFGKEGDWTLKVVLTFSPRWHLHSYGRVRLSLSRLDEIKDISDSLSEVLKKPEAKLSREDRQAIATAFLSEADPQTAKALEQDWTAHAKLKAEIPPVMVMEEMEVPRPAFVLDRGAYDQPIGDPVAPGSPEALNPFLEEYPPNRLGLAQWVTSRDNPLTARVAVNHLWDQFFGVGITKTVEDFGAQGEWPSHPALLDWLAIELIESGWDLQYVVNLILDSATYRQSSATRPEIEKVDPQNRTLARGPRGRFSAEMIRDQALSVSGLLNPAVGGPGVNPYQPAGIWEELTKRPGYMMTYEVSPGDAIYRRSIYTFWKRAAPPAMMSVFDAPSREICAVRRESTNTPLQALALLNGDTYVEAARSLAQRLLREEPEASNDELIREAFHRIVQRSPGAEEMLIATQLFQSESARISDAESTRILTIGRLPLDETLPQGRLLGLTMVNRLFFNLSETITRH